MAPDRTAFGVTDLPIPDQVEPTPATPRPAPVDSVPFEPLSPARYKVQFTASAELREKLQKLRALLRSEVPDGDLATIVETAVSEKLERLEARRFAQTRSPQPCRRQAPPATSSRHIPAAVRRAVYRRDRGRCRFVDRQGRASRASPARVPPPAPVRARRDPRSRQHLPDVPGPQSPPGRARLREEGHRQGRLPLSRIGQVA
jgi:hypothetical protein